MSTGRRGVEQGTLEAAFAETRDFQGEMISEHIHVEGEHVFEPIQSYFATRPPKSRFHRSGRRGQRDDSASLLRRGE